MRVLQCVKKTAIFFTISVAPVIVIPSAYAATKYFSPYADMTLSVHWDNHYQDLEPVDLIAVSKASGLKSFHLAFITDSGACNPTWGGQPSYGVNASWGSHLSDGLRAKNISYTVSFGGASGTDLSKACSTSQLAAAYEKVIKVYQPRGIDFDIENGTANVATIISALTQVQAAYPHVDISFTLPVMPEGLTASGQDVLNQAAAANLHYAVNVMAMDFGPSYTNDMGQYAIQAAINLFNSLKILYPQAADNDLWSMIEVTPMIGVNDVNVEQFTLANADTLQKFAATNHLGNLHMWSISRDNPCADKSASNVCSGNNLQKKSYEFSAHFMDSGKA